MAARSRAQAEEGRATQSDLGRLEQQELSAESEWINAVRQYRRILDDFKIEMGLPVDAPVILDDRELEALEIRHPEIRVDDSIQVALVARLDYQNQRDAFDDSVRRVDLAQNGLLPQLDLVADATISSPDRTNGFAWPEFDRYNWNAGLQFDPGLDRQRERTSYRSALIAQERSARALSLLRDQIAQEVRESWRSLEQARRTFEISALGVKIAERRVEEQSLLAELGRARAQDQVDAQNDLVNSRNQMTQALVGHTIARLQFWNNLGILYVKENGEWEERADAKTE